MQDNPALAIWALKDVATLRWYGGGCEQDEQCHQSHRSGENPGIASHVHHRKGNDYAKHTLARCYLVVKLGFLA